MTGGSCSTMQLEVYDKDNKLVCSLNDDSAMLGSYPIENSMRLHVIDKFSIRNELNFGNVEKYEMAPELYAKRSDTVRAFLVKNKMGKIVFFLNSVYCLAVIVLLSSCFQGQYNDDYIQKKQKQEEEEKKLADSTVIGSRCKVSVPNAPVKLGTVLYAGTVEGLSGHWIGVKYDEPLGKNNGR